MRRVELGLPLRWPLGCDPQSLVDCTVGAMTRRGKYLWLPLAPPASALHMVFVGMPDLPEAIENSFSGSGLLIHLGMSGALAFSDAQARGKYDHFRLETDRGTLRLSDPRRFGAVVWSRSLNDDPARKLLSSLGPEPFDLSLDGATFHAALRKRRVAVKTALLCGEVVVGAGNIYACEALFVAGIDPRTPANRISAPRAGLLLAALREVLGRAIDAGG